MKTLSNPSVAIVVLMSLTFIPTSEASDDTESIVGVFAGQGANFEGVLLEQGSFTGVADPSGIEPTVWTFTDDDETEQLLNQTTLFEIDFASGPNADNRFNYVQRIEFIGGTGDFEDVTGSAWIFGTIDVSTFSYDGLILGALTETDEDDD